MTEQTKPMKPEAKVEAKGSIKSISAVYGRMVDPNTGETFDSIPRVAGPITSWVQCQIDAGKLKIE